MTRRYLVVLQLAAILRSTSADPIGAENEAVMVDDILYDGRPLTFCKSASENLTRAAAAFCEFHQIRDARCREHLATLPARDPAAWARSAALAARLRAWQRSWTRDGADGADGASARARAELVVVAQFRDEADNLAEWLAHHAREGVGHFYLIDNNSSDAYLAPLAPWLARGAVTLFADPAPLRQRANYNAHALALARAHAWVATLDLDEFLYARAPRADGGERGERGERGENDDDDAARDARTARATVLGYLRSLPACVGSVQVATKDFGSGGLDAQPASLVGGFVRRRRLPPGDDAVMSLVNSKVVSRGEAIARMGTHCNALAPGWLQIDATGVRTPHPDLEREVAARPDALGAISPYAVYATERHLDEARLHLNHYTLQSRARYLAVKARRGAAEDATLEYSARVFDASDPPLNERFDDELRRKREHQQRAARPGDAAGVSPDEALLREQMDEVARSLRELARTSAALEARMDELKRRGAAGEDGVAVEVGHAPNHPPFEIPGGAFGEVT